ncbi:MAG: proton-conducting transporter membrane subunit, partial [Myxococcota bacterium]
YMVVRMNPVFAASESLLLFIGIIAAATAFIAGTSALAQRDLKGVLAYSTVSQLGYMFLGLAAGAWSSAIFHLVTHAFFKALLFLGAGSVILAMHHEQDIEKMGGLGRRIYKTKAVFLIGVYAIAGFPPFSGFFSKEEILLTAWASDVPGHTWLYATGIVTAALTSFYMWRLHFRVFWGECRAPASVRDHIAEPANTVLFPLYGLAALALLGGVMGIPQVYGDWVGVESSHSLNNFLSGVFPPANSHAISHALEYGLAGAAVVAALLGLGLSYFLYVKRPELPGQLATSARGLHRLLVEKYYVDELYDAVLVRPLVWVSERVLFRGVDAALIDGLAVNGTARGVRGIAQNGLKYLQSGLAQGYVFLMVLGAVAIVGYLVGS